MVSPKTLSLTWHSGHSGAIHCHVFWDNHIGRLQLTILLTGTKPSLDMNQLPIGRVGWFSQYTRGQ